MVLHLSSSCKRSPFSKCAFRLWGLIMVFLLKFQLLLKTLAVPKVLGGSFWKEIINAFISNKGWNFSRWSNWYFYNVCWLNYPCNSEKPKPNSSLSNFQFFLFLPWNFNAPSWHEFIVDANVYQICCRQHPLDVNLPQAWIPLCVCG